jgi:lipopolysaccharide/colanic/teichoic acid biosynthesis glycosyltransferase
MGERMTAAVQDSQTWTPIKIATSYQRAKRVLDLLVAVLALAPIGLILMLLVALLVWLDSPGPILLRQRRVGMHGQEFDMLKFRSMYHNADDTPHRQASERWMAGRTVDNAGASGAVFKLAGDPRITRVGRFIRRTSLDELPQFFNVLRGQMSVVGPRPPMPYEVESYKQEWWLRLSAKPGLTGTWQVYAR